MKYRLLILMLFVLLSCKKETVDSSSQQAFQQSVNDMTSSLNTIRQIKFNEALYVIKTFAVKGEGEIEKMKNLANLLSGKKTDDIFSMADQLATQNNYDWSSTGTPSMGEMNIFQNITASEFDPNDIKANGLQILIQPRGGVNTQEGSGMQIIPFLINSKGEKIVFDGAGLQVSYEILSNGVSIYRSRGIISDNNYTGLNLPFKKLNKNSVENGIVDVKASIITSKQTYRFTKNGILVNTNALYVPSEISNTEPTPRNNAIADTTSVFKPINTNNTTETTPNVSVVKTPALSPKAQLSSFLNNISTKNYKSAFDKSQNNSWGSYDNFANANSGFGAIQDLDVQSLKEISQTDKTVQYEAVYNVTDKSGNKAKVKSQYELKIIDNTWKITNYKIISTE